jgi:hypothetical protein
MQCNICWTANRADREVMHKTENETNNISELKSDKNISSCILACNRAHKKMIMEIQSYIKSTLLRHDTTLVCTQIHYLWRLKNSVVKAYIWHTKKYKYVCYQKYWPHHQKYFYDKILPEKYLFVSQYMCSGWFQTCQ